MNHDALLNDDWASVVSRLGGAEWLEAGARAARAFRRPREIKSAVDLLRLVLAYCLGKSGLRVTAGWAAAIGFVDVSAPALLYRLRQCGDWFSDLVAAVLAAAAPARAKGRLIRIIDGTAVAKAGHESRRNNRLWRIHAAFDLPHERFGDFVLTDERGGEQLDRVPVVKGEIRIADRAYLQPDRIDHVLAQGGDVVLRAGWKAARWQDAGGKPIDLIAWLRTAAEEGLIDRPIWVGRKGGVALALRLVAIKKPPTAAAAARRKARRGAQREGCQLSRATLAAADWVILLTSLPADAFPTTDVLALYRLRWRIELAFKRLKSIVGLEGPPGFDERSARPYVLAYLLMILLLEPLVDQLEDSPRWADAA